MVIVVVAMDFLHFLVALLALANGGAFSVLTVETLISTHLAVVGHCPGLISGALKVNRVDSTYKQVLTV